MIHEWMLEEKDEQISQAALLLKRLLETPEDCELRNVVENWLADHKAYVPTEPTFEVVKLETNEIPEAKSYDISLLDGDEKNLKF